MDTAANAGVIWRLVEDAVNTNRLDLLTGFVHADVRVHPGTPGTAPATESIKELATAFRRFHAVFPDLHVTIEDVVAEGDRVAARWIATGTHSAELAGIAATGRAVTWGGTDIYRLVDGRIAEWWRNDDFVWLLQQLEAPALPA